MSVEIVLGKTVQSTGTQNGIGDLLLVLLGALIAGVTSFLVQRYSHKKAVEESARERLEAIRSDSLIGLFKLGEIINALHSYKVNFSEMSKIADAQGPNTLGRCVLYSPLIGVDISVPHIEGKELLFLLEAGEPRLVSDVYLAEKKLAATVSIASQFSELRLDLQKDLEKYHQGVNDQRMVDLKLPRDEFLLLKPKLMALDKVIFELEKMIDDSLSHSLEVASKMSSAGKKYFGSEKFLRLTPKQEESE